MTEDGRGASYWWDGVTRHFDAVDIEVVDTTGAGDACVGALAAAIVLGMSFDEAVTASMRAGSTAVLAPGAASSYVALPRLTRS